MAKDNRKHHVVASSYLAAFASPQTKDGRLFVMDQDLHIYPGSPAKILRRTDFYLVRNEDGTESLEVEREYLSGIENLYATHTKPKILKNEPLNDEDKAVLSLMAASMLARSPLLRSSEEDFFGRIKKTMDIMNALPQEQKEAMAKFSIPGKEEDRIPGDVMEKIAADVPSWHSEGIPDLTASMFPYIWEMKCNVIVSNDPANPFVTSDNPCAMVNPELERVYGRGAMYSSPGVGQKHIEITLPLSPTHALMFGYLMERDLQYVPFGANQPEMLQTVNGRTARMSHNLVSNTKEQLEEIKLKAQKTMEEEQLHDRQPKD